MDNNHLIPHEVKSTAHWLTMELFDDLAMDDPASMKPHFMGWLAGFRIVKNQLYRHSTGPDLLVRVQKEANRYYEAHLIQVHHTPEDRAWFCFMLTRALLMASGHFKLKGSNQLRISKPSADYLSVEQLHAGHYINLTDAVRLMLGSGKLDRKYEYEHPLIIPYDACLSLN